ncbi:hypothetical protein [Haloarchaeobius sp. DYHT-AS-18]|uniref:hypothetical protein n=1 Tax=Haloarchaeobius sp. DYHT-AS-18 TaxID=3446117 RepID=UPI003EBAE9FD
MSLRQREVPVSPEPRDSKTRLDRRLDEPARFQRPEDWTFSGAWHRAQAANHVVGPTDDPAVWKVMLGEIDAPSDLHDPHEVLFAIYHGQLRAECNCHAWKYNQWCAHVALLWWQWSRERLVVLDVDASRHYEQPPWWLSLDHSAPHSASRGVVATDGGERR